MSKKILSTNTLRRIAIVGGVVTVGTGLFLQNRLQRIYSYEFYVREPIKLLRGYSYAEQLLGKPILPGNIKFNDDNVNISPVRAEINIPVKGPKGNALLYSLSERETPESEWEVVQLDLQLDPRTPKWTFYKRVGSGNETQTGSGSSNDLSSKDQTSDNTDKIATVHTDSQSSKEKKKELKWI